MLAADFGDGETGERGTERAGERGAALFSPVRNDHVRPESDPIQERQRTSLLS